MSLSSNPSQQPSASESGPPSANTRSGRKRRGSNLAPEATTKKTKPKPRHQKPKSIVEVHVPIPQAPPPRPIPTQPTSSTPLLPVPTHVCRSELPALQIPSQPGPSAKRPISVSADNNNSSSGQSASTDDSSDSSLSQKHPSVEEPDMEQIPSAPEPDLEPQPEPFIPDIEMEDDFDQDLQGASRTIGGFARGRAHGSAPNTSDIDWSFDPPRAPMKNMVYFYFSSDEPSTINCDQPDFKQQFHHRSGSIAFIADYLEQGWSSHEAHGM